MRLQRKMLVAGALLAFASAPAIAQSGARTVFDTQTTTFGLPVNAPQPAALPPATGATTPVDPAAFNTQTTVVGRPVDPRTAYRQNAEAPGAAVEGAKVRPGAFDTQSTVAGRPVGRAPHEVSQIDTSRHGSPGAWHARERAGAMTGERMASQGYGLHPRSPFDDEVTTFGMRVN